LLGFFCERIFRNKNVDEKKREALNSETENEKKIETVFFDKAELKKVRNTCMK
jgi:hypothetical protein